jgi:hypothetical protein
MLFVLNTTKVGHHTYSDKDIKAVVELKKYTDPATFYGGRFKWAGETDIEGLIMLMDNSGGTWAIRDMAITDFNIIGIRPLREIAEGKKYTNITALDKEELIHLIETGERPRKDKS